MNKLATSALAALLLAAAPVLADWRLNTFPGPGHAAQSDRFAPGEGSDRAEWVSGFGVSPLVADGFETPLMLQVTDLGPLVVSHEGQRFVPADLPIAGGHAVAFSPHDGNRAYAFMRHDPVIGIDHGWWRSDDRGRTWQYMVAAPEIRGQMRNLIHDPHPGRAAHLYLTAAGDGIMRSTDDGQTFETIDVGGHVHTLAAVAEGKRTHLYVVMAPADAKEVREGTRSGPHHYTKFVGQLVHFTVDADGSMSEPTMLHEPVVDVETHADHPDYLLLLSPTGEGQAKVLRARLDGKKIAEVTELWQGYHRRGGTIRANPANADHLVHTTFGALVRHPLQVSKDGGQTWQSFAIETIDGEPRVPGLRDYGPFNHRSPDGSISADSHNKIDGERDLLGFLPGDADSVVGYFTNMPKAPLRSDDFGVTWSPFATGGTFKPSDQIATSADGQTIVLAMSEYGALITTDGGTSWRGYHHVNTPAMRDAYAAHEKEPNPWKSKTGWGVALDPTDPNVVLLTYGWGPTHVLRSENAGETWQSVATYQPRLASDLGKPYLDATGIFWHPQDEQIVYAGSLKSIDGGRTFEPMAAGKFVTAMSPHDGDRLVCREFASNLWVSADGGDSWTKLPSPPRINNGPATANYNLNAVAIDPTFDGWRLLLGGLGGVYIYQAPADEPAAGFWEKPAETVWQPLLAQVTDDADEQATIRLGHVIADPRPEHVGTFYATPGAFTSHDRRLHRAGVFMTTDAGKTWQMLDELGRRELITWWKPTAAPAVVPATGELLVPDYTGLFIASP